MASRLANPHSWTRVAWNLGRIAFFAHFFQSYIGGVGTTQGISMLPTIPAHYKKRPWILYSTLYRRGRGVQIGDVITYTHPMFPNEAGCKRIIGMPGDFVSVITPARNETDIEADDVDSKWASVKEQVIQVPAGHCWVAGDNLEWSRDSRLYGPLPLGLIKSKVLAVVLPVKEAKWLGAEVELKDVQEQEHEWIITR
ncbi:peptidase S24/S26A/S26B/S26C [Phaeosphaeriaceae sp. PMI808]|nr:peptidase S24/S26A/S26B/S26C [Phaeosphaeriaceae sp. PMI808]